MKRSVNWFWLVAALLAAPALSAGLRIGYLYPAIEYDSETSLKWIAAQMESRFGATSVEGSGNERHSPDPAGRTFP